ncbi:hypothetical protein N7467_005415 [Penicillium canescens]|nr:hypothetical protein N7467_005415 [Penicillium canescens]
MLIALSKTSLAKVSGTYPLRFMLLYFIYPRSYALARLAKRAYSSSRTFLDDSGYSRITLLSYILPCSRLSRFIEIFLLGIIHGIVSSSFILYCRSFFRLLIPPSSEAAFYALYVATNKGSLFIGPAILGTDRVLLNCYANRVAYSIMNTEKGRRDTLAIADSLKDRHKSHGGATNNA